MVVSRPNRRRVLATLGTALTAGCLRSSRDDDSTPAPGTDAPRRRSADETTTATAAPSGSESTLTPASLSTEWSHEADLAFSQAGVAAEGIVLTQRSDGRICVARALRDGSQQWRATFDAEVSLRPRIVGSTVLMGTVGGTIHALARSDGSERWRYDTPGALRVQPVVVPEEATVLVPIRFDDERAGLIDAVSLESGQRRWRIDGIDRPTSISPVVDGRFYLGFSDSFRGYAAGDGTQLPAEQQPSGIPGVNAGRFPHARILFAHEGTVYLPEPRANDPVVAYDPTANEVAWRYEPFGTPVSFDTWGETLTFTASDNAVYGLDRTTGDRRWRVQRDDRLSPVVAARGVVWTARGRTLLGIDAETGTVHVERELPLSADLVFAVGRRVIVLGSGQVGVYRIES
jgi:outer membrane protein assembly factor BamB